MSVGWLRWYHAQALSRRHTWYVRREDLEEMLSLLYAGHTEKAHLLLRVPPAGQPRSRYAR